MRTWRSPALQLPDQDLPASRQNPEGESPMNVNNVGPDSPVQKLVQNPIQKQLPADASTPTRATDRLELSGASHLLRSLKSDGTDKVASVKAQIEAGTYEDDHKLNVA